MTATKDAVIASNAAEEVKDQDLRQRRGGAGGTDEDKISGEEDKITGSCKVSSSPWIRRVESDQQVHDDRLSVGAIRKAMPPDVFVKDARRSLQWMLWDMTVTMALLRLGKHFFDVHVAAPGASSFNYLFLIPLFVVTGFFQWCCFVCGHDCGHTTFSTSYTLNFVCGLITHGSILVPFSAWRRSHHFHHLYHNHVEKDYSFPWINDPALDWPASKTIHATNPIANFARSALFPVFGYAFYLGAPEYLFGAKVGADGCHYLPFARFMGMANKLWEDAPLQEVVEAWISTFVVAAWACGFIYFLYDGSITQFVLLYLPCWFTFTFCLFTVTYLQHHTDGEESAESQAVNKTGITETFDDTTFSYVTAAFETVDRDYTSLINFLHHHISDCHVVHHLFFTKIPHYNLRKATDALVAWLEQEQTVAFDGKTPCTLRQKYYRLERTYDFALRVGRQMKSKGMRAMLVTKDDSPYYARMESAANVNAN